MPRSTTAAVAACALLACSGDPPDWGRAWRGTVSRVRTETVVHEGVDGHTVTHRRPWLTDARGRYVHVNGINVSGSHKAPPTEDFPSRWPLPPDADDLGCRDTFPMPAGCVPDDPLDRSVSYVGRPFPEADADRWFSELSRLGFNAVRLLTNWESIQPYRPGTCGGRDGYDEACHDLAYLAYYERLVEKAADHGLYVLVDMHQDVFSRHLFAYYNEAPSHGEPGSLEHTVLSLLPPYTDWVRGHGAPRWVVEACLPEKDLDSPYWGMFRAFGGFKDDRGRLNLKAVDAINRLYRALSPGADEGLPEWIVAAFDALPGHFEPWETSDFLPWTWWPANGGLSLDADRCFAAFFAGDAVFPGMEVEGQTIQAYLQEQFTGSWRALASRTRGHDNVIGYDLLNEPVGVFALLGAAAVVAQTGVLTGVEGLLHDLLGDSLGADLFLIVRDLGLLPTYPDATPADGETEAEAKARADAAWGATLAAWGMQGIDTGAVLDLNLRFDEGYLQPFYERVGAAVQEVDPDAVIWFEPGASLRVATGPSFQWDHPLTRPKGLRQLVFAPHWYPDIYPTLGIAVRPREFGDDEWLYRDFSGPLSDLMAQAPAWLGNVPVVFGEFGTYFNYGGSERSVEQDHLVSAQVLNSYYEAFEELSLGRMVWCFSAENDAGYGEHWNHEDFSVFGPDGKPRAWSSWARPHASATSGRLIREEFVSDLHFWDPVQGEPRPDRRYTLRMHARESEAPTEVAVPAVQYPEGFYLWLSDGWAYFDAGRRVLYWYPDRNEPGVEHALRIDPPLPDREALGWRYFFRDDQVLRGTGGAP